MGIQLSDRVENIVRKGEIAHNEQFLLFLQCFQKLSVVDGQNEFLWSKGLTLYYIIPTFNDLERKSFLKHCGIRRKCW